MPEVLKNVSRISVGLLPLVALVGAMTTAPAVAQSEANLPQICWLSGGEPLGEGTQTVYASCWGTGLVLGEAERFASYPNIALGATAVELEHAGQTRVMVIRALPDGQPIVEDMGSVLADAAGRTSLGTTEGLVADLSAFGETGMIGVSEANAGADEGVAGRAAAQGRSATAAQIDISAFIQNDPVSANALSDQ